MPTINTIDETKISENIQVLRHRAGLTQEAVAKKLNVPLTTYVLYEANSCKIKATTVYKLSKIFGCSISSFYLK